MVSLIFLGAAALFFVVYVALLIMEKQGIYLYVHGILSPKLRIDMSFPAILLLDIGLILFSVKRVNSTATAGWSMVLAVGLTAIYAVLSVRLWFQPIAFTHMMSPEPDGKGTVHEIVFAESVFLLGGHGTVYERISDILLRKLGTYETDDGDCPVENDHYEIIWHEDGFTFSGGLAENKEFSYAP